MTLCLGSELLVTKSILYQSNGCMDASLQLFCIFHPYRILLCSGLLQTFLQHKMLPTKNTLVQKYFCNEKMILIRKKQRATSSLVHSTNIKMALGGVSDRITIQPIREAI